MGLRPTGIHFVPLISSIVNRPSKTQMCPEKKKIPIVFELEIASSTRNDKKQTVFDF